MPNTVPTSRHFERGHSSVPRRVLITAWLAVAALAGVVAVPLAAPAVPAAPAPAAQAVVRPGEVTPGAEVPVHRWWQAGDRDWISIPTSDDQPSDSQMASFGYIKSQPAQFYVHLDGSAEEGMVAVNRWWNAADRDWVDITVDSFSDATLATFGYTGKTFQFWLYEESGDDLVAVNRWWNASDRDWITLRQDEIADGALLAWGYTGKTLLGYAATEPSEPPVPTAHLTLTKEVATAEGEPVTAEAWTLEADGPTPLSGAGGVARTEVETGTYTLSETGSSAGYTNGTAWECVDSAATPLNILGSTVTLEEGDDVSCTITNTRFPASLTPGTAAPTPVNRHWHLGLRDWIGVADHPWQQPNLSGYTDGVGPQFWVPMIGTNDQSLVAVHRWWNDADEDWVDITEGSISDTILEASGYAEKTFQYYLYDAAADGRVAVNRWWNPTDRDWVTLRDGEYQDADLLSWGYTMKIPLGWAIADEGEGGYVQLGTPQAKVVPRSQAADEHPQTFSVVDVNPARDASVNEGYRYRGYVSHSACGGVYVARANDLDADPWVQDPDPVEFEGTAPCGWASAVLLPDGKVALVTDGVAGETITARVSTDGRNGVAFGPETVLVSEAGTANRHASVLHDTATGSWYLYWAREDGAVHEVRVRAADEFSGLVGSGVDDLGTRVAFSAERLEAPSVVSIGGVYHLTVQTEEDGTVRTRALTASSPAGPFYEVPDNPVYGAGAGCVFQHVFGHELHSYYCAQGTPGDDTTWTLDHVAANLLGQLPPEPVDCTVEQCVALSFNDGASTFFLSILNVLEDADAHGTFFLLGKNVAPKYPVVQRVASLGNDVGVHGWDLRDLTVLDEAAITTQFQDSVAALEDVIGERPAFVRPPFGLHDATVDGVAEDLGLAIVLWNVDPADLQYVNATELREAVVGGVSRGSIVSLRGDASATVLALPGILEDLQGAGYTLVTVSELLGETQPGQVYTSQQLP